MELKNISLSAPIECSGCGACVAACPCDAVSLEVEGGHYRAVADAELCSNCGLCLRVCHRFADPAGEPSIYDALSVRCGHSTDADVLSVCSSGGAVYELSRYCLSEGYHVIGAVYDTSCDRVKHIEVDSEDGLTALSGSKYLPSFTADALSALRKGRKYLFVGSPCQVYGARMLARAKGIEDDMVFVDFFCHGNSSLTLWDRYIAGIKSEIGSPLRSVIFRSKDRGWHDFFMKISSDRGVYGRSGYDDDFYALFLSDACIQRGCFKCRFRFDKIYSDIRVGDFWGQRFKDNNTGVSVISAHSEKGEAQMRSVTGSGFEAEDISFEDLRAAKEGPNKGVKPVPRYRDRACELIEEGDLNRACAYVRRCLKGSPLRRAVSRALRLIKK